MKRSAGYSGTPLVAKLGVKADMQVSLVDAPRDFAKTLGRLPAGAKLQTRLARNAAFIVAFVRAQRTLVKEFPRWKMALAPDGTLWVCWPKRSSPLAGDVDENIVREVGLSNGLVDVKVCAVDEDWSGLKFVYRLKDRARS
jgi:hypothetical protein